MSSVVVSPRAQADIEEIWDYTAACWNTEQAETYIRDIERVTRMIAASPKRGRSCEDIRRGYFKHPVGSHMIFYRSINDGIEVIRILHQRMDYVLHL